MSRVAFVRAAITWILVAIPLSLSAKELYLDLDHDHEVIYSRDLKEINGEINASHLVILGVKLGAINQQTVESKLGVTKGYLNNAGHHVLLMICYGSNHPGDNTKVLFGIDDDDYQIVSFHLLSSDFKLKGSKKCYKSSLVSKTIATDSGLKLGMSQEQVKTMLGAPSKEETNRLIYDYQIKKQYTEKELAERYRDSPPEAKLTCEYYYDYGWIDAKFVKSLLVSLEVIKGGEGGGPC